MSLVGWCSIGQQVVTFGAEIAERLNSLRFCSAKGCTWGQKSSSHVRPSLPCGYMVSWVVSQTPSRLYFWVLSRPTTNLSEIPGKAEKLFIACLEMRMLEMGGRILRFQPTARQRVGLRATSFKTLREGTSTFPSERDFFCESIRLGLRNRCINFELFICSLHKRLYNFSIPAS